MHARSFVVRTTVVVMIASVAVLVALAVLPDSRASVFFVLSKLFWAMAQPFNMALLLLGLALYWLYRGRLRAARRLLTAVVLAGASISLLPVSDWLLLPLEQRFPVLRQYPPTVSGIIVLGGPERLLTSHQTGMPQFDEGQERLTYALELARRYPQARVVFTGGSGTVRQQTLKGADVAAAFFMQQGLAPERLVLERDSRNTDENARMTRQLLQPQPQQRWLLVTSAFHMPRSMGIFRRAGWEHVTAAPCDYRARSGFALARGDAASNLALFSVAVREWTGLLVYYAAGKTTSLLPAP